MGKNWATIIAANYTKWKMTQDYSLGLDALATAAETALAEAQNAATRTPVATAKCKEAFENLIKIMRDIKKRFFYVPPLTDADIVSLGLKPHDTTPTPSGVPGAQAMIETI